MHRQPVTPEQLDAPVLALDRAAARHLRTVLRLRPGDELELFDGAGRAVRVRVREASREGLVLEHAAPPVRHEPPATRLTLCACVCKGGRMDWTVEKAVELGASRIVPVLSARSVVRLDDPGEALDRAERWRRVAVDAARQCGACWLPRIDPPVSLEQAVSVLRACDPLLVAALSPVARPLREVLVERRGLPAPADAAWVVGPEGDFSAAELDALRAAGAIPVSLGSLVLRAETAALYGLCVLGAEWA